MPRGGNRRGAGRPRVKLSRGNAGLRKRTAEEILADPSFDEKDAWLCLLNATTTTAVAVINGEDGQREEITIPDHKIRLEALKYLTDRRDGKPRQSVQIEDLTDPLDFGSLPTPAGDSRTIGKPN